MMERWTERQAHNSLLLASAQRYPFASDYRIVTVGELLEVLLKRAGRHNL